MWKYFALNFKKYLVLRGRTSRLEFWSFVTCSLMLMLVGMAVSGFLYALEHFFNIVVKLGSVNGISIGFAITLLTGLVLIMPLISVAVRRNHDMGLSGWFIVLPGINLILWCMPSKNKENYFDDNNVFEPSRILGLSLIWMGYIALIFYAIAAFFLFNANVEAARLASEPVQENTVTQEAPEESKAEETSFIDQADDGKDIQEVKEEKPESLMPGEYDGEIIQTEQLEDGTLITMRRHNQKVNVKLIMDTNIYDSIQYKNIVGSISIPQEVQVTAIAKTQSLLTTANTTEIWLRIDDNGFDGYLYAGAIPDPYENDFYMVLDQFQFADEKWTVRNMGERFYSFKNGTEIYDMPGVRHSNKIGVIQVKGDISPEYSISAITEETTTDRERAIAYPWLRLDSDGKSGWIYGKFAVSENGTPDFPTPKFILQQNLQ